MSCEWMPRDDRDLVDALGVENARLQAEVERLKKALALPDDRSSEDLREALRSEMIILGGKAYEQIAELEAEAVRLREQLGRAERQRRVAVEGWEVLHRRAEWLSEEGAGGPFVAKILAFADQTLKEIFAAGLDEAATGAGRGKS